MYFVRVDNQGTPSVARDFFLTVAGSSGVTQQDLRPFQITGPLRMPSENLLWNNDPAERIYSKTGEVPIPRGCSETGNICFRVKATKAQIGGEYTEFAISFSDVLDRKISIKFRGYPLGDEKLGFVTNKSPLQNSK
jgi:hypothetical protein